MAKANGLSGLYIVLDGIVGTGESEQGRQLKSHLSLDFPQGDFLFTYEPGGNPEADLLRQKVKFEKMSPVEEMRIFAKSRSITIPKVVIPALLEGQIVISDRSVTTSLAYQAFGRELGIHRVWEENKKAICGVLPDVVVWMNVGLEACLKRSAGQNPDKFDAEDRIFWTRTINGYSQMLHFLKSINSDIKTIQIDDLNGSMNIEQMRLAIKERLYPYIENNLGSEGRIVRDRQI
jgi:dTMP kinase